MTQRALPQCQYDESYTSEISNIVDQCKKRFLDLASVEESLLTTAENHWVHVTETDGVRVWHRSFAPSPIYAFQCRTKFQGVSNASEFVERVFLRALCEPEFRAKVDPVWKACGKLHDLPDEAGNIEQGNRVLMYSIFNTNGGIFVSDRDFVYVRDISRVVLQDGRNATVIVSESIPSSERLVPRQSGLVRGDLRIFGLLLVEDPKNNCLDVTYIAHTEPNGAIPAFLINGFASAQYGIVLRWKREVESWSSTASLQKQTCSALGRGSRSNSNLKNG